MASGMLTHDDGPVVISEKSLRALLAIRRERLLAEQFGEVAMAQSVAAAMGGVLPTTPWLVVLPDHPEQTLPERVSTATPSERATLQLALALPASLVVIDGPIKEKAKLSYIKCEGVLGLLVQAYRTGRLSAVQPMVKALEKLGHGDVLPPEHVREALWRALAGLE